MSLAVTMPTILLERIPLPSLHTYISFSVLILALASFYAHQTVNAKLNFNPENQIVEELGLPPELTNVTLPFARDEHFYNMLYIMRIETWCIWVCIVFTKKKLESAINVKFYLLIHLFIYCSLN